MHQFNLLEGNGTQKLDFAGRRILRCANSTNYQQGASTKYKEPSTKYQIPSANYQLATTKYKVPGGQHYQITASITVESEIKD